MSICVEYSVDPKRTSGGLYLKKTHPISLIQRMLRDGAAKHKGPVNYTRSNPNHQVVWRKQWASGILYKGVDFTK